MEYYGYAGKILYVNLSTGEVKKEPLDLEMARRFIGGEGIAWRLLYDLLKPNTDPLSPDNPVILAAGPLVGTLSVSTGKVMAITKLPLSTVWGDEKKYAVSVCSGGSRRFGIMLKNAGYDELVITGRAEKPSYLRISDDDVELCDASDLWGQKDIYETTEELMKRHRGCGVIAIGKSGENLAKISMSMIDGTSTVGRNGLGAIWGSKNLKAITAYGTKGVRVADEKRFMAVADEQRRRLAERAHLADVSSYEGPGDQGRVSAEWLKLYPNDIWFETKTAVLSCTACLSPCRTSFHVRDGRFAGTPHRTQHMHMLGTFGPQLRIPDYRDAIKLIYEINRAGLCFLSTARMIAFVTRLYARGDISTKETDGLELRRDVDCYLDLVDKIVNREGLGDYIAEGWYALSKKIGVDAREHFDGSPISRGADANADARGFGGLTTTTLASVIRTRPGGTNCSSQTYVGGRHLGDLRPAVEKHHNLSKEQSERIFPWKDFRWYRSFDMGRLYKHDEDGLTITNCLGTCALGPTETNECLNADLVAEAYSAATGIEMSPEEMRRNGEAVYTLQKLFNVREGFTREDEEFPPLWVKATETPAKTTRGEMWLTDYFGHILSKDDLKRIVDNYYDERGWDVAKGIPTWQKITELGLGEFAKDLMR